MKNNNPFKPGNRVRYKDGDNRRFMVYAIYSNTMLSLGLHDYPDVEQDYQVNIKEIEKI